LKQQGQSPAVLACQILDSYTTRWPKNPELKAYLAWFWKSPAFQEIDPVHQSQLAHQFGIDQFCENPSLSEPEMRVLATALRSLMNHRDGRSLWKKLAGSMLPGRAQFESLQQAEKDRIIQATIGELLKTPDDRCQRSLEIVLYHLGPVFSGEGRWVALFNELLRGCERDRSFWQRTELFTAFVAVGTGYVGHREFKGLVDQEAHFLMYRLSEDLRGKVRRNRTTPAVCKFATNVKTWKKGEGWQDWGLYWQSVLAEAPPSLSDDSRNNVRRRTLTRDSLLMILITCLVFASGALYINRHWIVKLFWK